MGCELEQAGGELQGKVGTHRGDGDGRACERPAWDGVAEHLRHAELSYTTECCRSLGDDSAADRPEGSGNGPGSEALEGDAVGAQLRFLDPALGKPAQQGHV